MDRLEIKGLTVMTHIGVHQWEQQILQKLLIDMELQIDCKAAQDNLSNTIDYARLCQQVTAYVEQNHFKLIETCAEQLAGYLKSEFGITHLCLKLSKPGAIPNAQNVAVIIAR